MEKDNTDEIKYYFNQLISNTWKKLESDTSTRIYPNESGPDKNGFHHARLPVSVVLNFIESDENNKYHHDKEFIDLLKELVPNFQLPVKQRHYCKSDLKARYFDIFTELEIDKETIIKEINHVKSISCRES